MKDYFKKDEKDFLKNLLVTPSPSGYETLCTKVFKDFNINLASNGVKDLYIDSMGNCQVCLGNGENKVMISGHIDEIALQVSNITEDGFLNVVPLGGIDIKTIPGSEVVVITSNYDLINGVIGKKPIHVETEDERNDLIKLKDILVDIGAESKEEAENLVEIGDPIVINSNFTDLGNNKIMSKGLDDKIGVFISSIVFKKLSETIPDSISNLSIYNVANTQEELGLRGAIVTSKRINPKYSIDIDVTFSTDEDRGIEKSLYGDIKLGAGPVIMFGPDKSNRLIGIMKKVAKSHNIPIQLAVSDSGGTNTSVIQENGLDTETALISIPNRNMHTPVEICDYRDVIGAIELIYYTILELNYDI